MATERLRVVLEMMASQYKKEAREAATATGKIEKDVQKLGSTSGKTREGINRLGRDLGLAFGAAAVFKGLKSAAESAERINSIAAVTNQVIKETGGGANVTAEQLLKMADSLEVVTGIESELIQEGANVLLTFKNIRNEVGEGNAVFDRTVGLMLDIGAVMGTDASAAALQLGKALNDPITNMGALSRAGLTFSAEQKDMIKTLVESGNLLSAQTVILDELESQLGGTAAASADASDKISNAIGTMTDAIGLGLVPFIETAAIELQHLFGQIDELDRLAAITDQSRDSAELLAGALHQLGREYERAAADGVGFSDSTAEFTKEAAKLIDMAGLSVTEIEKLRGGLDFLVDTMGLSASQAEILAGILDEKLNKELARLTNQGADKVLRGKLNPALFETEEAAVGTAVALSDVSDEFQSMIDPAFKALNALDDYIEAQAELASVLSDSSTSSDEADAAGRRVLETYGDLVAAADAYSQVSGQNLIDSLRKLGTEAGVPLGVLNSIIDSLRAVDGFVATAKVNVVTTGGGGGGGTIQAKALGGPVNAGSLYMTGEKGPELFVPDTNGQVLNNQTTERLLAALSGLSGAGSYTKTGPTINLNGPVTGVTEVMGAVQRAAGLVAMVDLAEVNPR